MYKIVYKGKEIIGTYAELVQLVKGYIGNPIEKYES